MWQLLILTVFFLISGFFPATVVARSGVPQDCLANETCSGTCGPHADTGLDQSFVMFDIKSTKTLGHMLLTLRVDKALKIILIDSSYNTICFTSQGSSSPTPVTHSIASCLGLTARFIKIEALVTEHEDLLDICHFSYQLLRKLVSEILMSEYQYKYIPRAGIWRQNDVVWALLRRQHIVTMLFWRRVPVGL